ncbi:MAG: response regulator [Phycisphaerales bacterium]|nr:response regulator [Phycisphaerales bacterium]
MNDIMTTQLNLLLLGRCEGIDELAERLEARGACARVTNWSEAAQALKDRQYDVVVSDGNLLRFLMGMKRPPQVSPVGEAPASLLLTLDAQARIIGRSAPGSTPTAELEPAVHRECLQMLDQLAPSKPDTLACPTDSADARNAPTPCSTSPGRPLIAPRRFDLMTDAGEMHEATISPLFDDAGALTGFSAYVTNATYARRLQARINAIDNAGRQLVRIDAEQLTRLNVAERLALLEQKVMRYAHELLQFDHIAVFVLDRKNNKLELALASGMPSEVRGIDIYAGAEGNGISGYVAATGQSYLCPDVAKDPYYIQGLGDAKSSLTVPLTLTDQLVGVFNVESDRLAAFTEEDRQFAEILGRYIAIALHTLELLVTERHTTTGQLRQDVKAEVLGPVNDVLTGIETLKEDYIGLDDLRTRLGAISETVVGIRDAFSRITSPQPGVILPRNRRVARFDPVLREKRVLIADDEDIIRETVRDVLAGYGCEVTVACDGQAAVDHISGKAFDLVLSDIRLPGKNGYEIFAAARAANAHTPVILMTGFGYDPNHAIVRANHEGLNAVLFKPFKVDQLLSEIRTALKGATA